MDNHDTNIDPSIDPNDEVVSKSERKRQMHRLQTLGETLLQLKPDQLAELSLSGTLQKALQQMATITKHEAKRRQLQYIGKLMRKESSETIEAIESLLERIKLSHQHNNETQHQTENWRDQILNGGDTEIDRFLQTHPQADRQWLRQIRRQHLQETQHAKPPAAARKLFRYLRDFIEQ